MIVQEPSGPPQVIEVSPPRGLSGDIQLEAHNASDTAHPDIRAMIGANLRVWNPTTESFYILTLTGAAGDEYLTFTPEP